MKIIETILLFEYFLLIVCGLRVKHEEVFSKPDTIWGNQNGHGDGPDQRIDTRAKRSLFECGVHGQVSTIDSMSEENTLPGEWPWVVAVVRFRDNKFTYKCSASLIDNRFALTTADCIDTVRGHGTVKLDEIAIIVGVKDVSRHYYNEDNIRLLTAIYMHEEYNTIAMLVLKEPVTFSKLVKPVCLWEGEDVQDGLEKAIKYGTEVGWSAATEWYSRPKLEEPQRFNMSIMSHTTCQELSMDNATTSIVNEKTFCTVSGRILPRPYRSSGLFVDQRGRWMLRGFHIDYIFNNNGSTIVFVDVAKYRNWISDTAYRWLQTSMFECGVHGQEPTINSLSADTTVPGEWPWVVAVFRFRDNEFTYKCSASLIDNRFALTTADCIDTVRGQDRMELDEIAIIVGVGDVSRHFYDEDNIRFLTAIYVHEEYNTIAMLVLKEPVTFSKLVKPVCLWEGEDDQDGLEKAIKYGTEIGWARATFKNSEPNLSAPHRFNMSITSHPTCRELIMEQANTSIINEKTFCAVPAVGKWGDPAFRGSGLFIEHRGHWTLRGIHSDDKDNKNGSTTVYVDVAKHRRWISDTAYRWLQTNVLPSTLPPSTLPPSTSTEKNSGTEKNIAWTQQCSKRDEVNTLITGGKSTREGEWPWHVAIYHTVHTGNMLSISYKCGGSLISVSHVLTTAHCLIDKQTNRPIAKSSIIIYLGTHNIKSFSVAVQFREVDRLEIHQEYKYETQYKDIAVLKLSSPAEVTVAVRPVCLWPEDEVDLSNVVGKNGSVVGWGYDEFGLLADELMLAELSVVSELTCLRSHYVFYNKYTNSFTFCAGLLQDTTVCNGESGGGMVFKLRSGAGTDVWFLRGLVSLSYDTKKPCDPSSYVVFTDVAKYLDWIKDSVSRDL